MKKKSLLFIFLLSTVISFSQYLEGTVLDEKTNKPIEGAHVFFNITNSGTLTGINGAFSLKLPPNVNKNYIVYFSHIGYETVELPYHKKRDDYSVKLIQKTTKLEEVNYTQKRIPRSSLRYSRLAPMKYALHSFGSLLKDNKIYVIGGDASFQVNGFMESFDENPDLSLDKLIAKANCNYSKQFYKGNLLVYDINRDEWETSDLKFRKRANHNLSYNNNKFYVIGGKRLSENRKFEYLDDKIEVFNQQKETIEIDDTNPHQASDFASFTYDNHIIIMGGSIKQKKNGSKVYSNKVHVFNTKTGLWFELDNMPEGKEVNGILVDNKIFLIGGFKEEALTKIESLDLKTNKWEEIGDLFEGVGRPAITHNNDYLYFFEKGKVYTFNIKTKELNEYLIDLDMKASKLYYSNNKLFILGGYIEEEYSLLTSRSMYSIDLNEFGNTKINKSKTL